jgi:hypothetical protein
MKKVMIFILILLPFVLAAQNEPEPESQNSSNDIEVTRPVQASQSPMITMRYESFNRKLDLYGKGELLQIEFQLHNQTDVDLNLYIFTFATYEEFEYEMNSFGDKPLYLNDMNILYFRADPADEELYTYEKEDGSSYFVKHPKDITKGVNPETGEPFKLDNTLIYRTNLLNHYRKKYNYFNMVTVLIFDADNNELLFRQVWTLDGRRK